MEDPMEAVILVAVTELLTVKIQPWHLSGHREGLLTEEVEATKKTTKTGLQDTRSLEQWI